MPALRRRSMCAAYAALMLVACGAPTKGPPASGSAPAPTFDARTPPAAYVEPAACDGPSIEPAPGTDAHPRLVLQERAPTLQRHVAISAAEGLLATVDFGGAVRVYDVARGALLWAHAPDYGKPWPTAVVWDGPRTLGIVAGSEITFVDPVGRPVDHATSARGLVRTAVGPRLRTLIPQVLPQAPARLVDAAGTSWSLVPPPELASSGLYDFHAGDAQLSADDSTLAIVPTAANDWVVVHRPLGAPGRVIARGVDEFSLSPQGDFIATRLRGQPTRIDTATGAARALETSAEDGNFGTLVVSSDGRTIYAYGDGRLRAWSSATGKRLWAQRIDDSPSALLTTDDGRVVAIGGTLSIYDAATGRLRRTLAPSRATRADWTAFDGRGGLFVSGSGRVDGWSLDRGARVSSADLAGARELAANAAGDMLVTRVTGRTCAPPGRPRGTPGTEVEFAPVASGAAAERACVPAATLAPSVFVDAGFTIDPIGRRALDMNARQVVDLATGQITQLEPTPHGIPAGGWTLAGDRVLGMANTDAGGFGGALEVWNARSGKRLYELAVSPNEASWSLRGAFSPDGKTLAVGKNRALVMFDAATGHERTRAALASDAADVAFVGEDVLVLGMDAALSRFRDGKLVARGAPLQSTHYGLRIEPGGRRAAASSDTGVAVWDVATLAPSATLTSFEDAEWAAFTPGGAYSGTAEVVDRVAFVYADPPEAFTFEQFATYRSPDIVMRRLRGEDVDGPPMVRPPEIAIVAAPRLDGAIARLDVEVRSAARVDAVRVFADGRPLAARAVCASAGRVQLTVPLLPGLNRLAAIAYDARGVASNPALVDVTSASVPSRRPTLWVASVGISEYPKLRREDQLKLADDDARAVASVFAKLAGPGAPYAAADVKMLLDEEATRERVLAAIDRLAGMSPDDVAIVFFAGHGAKPSQDEDTRVLTSDTAATAESIRATGVGWSDIATRLTRARGRVVVLLDACHSGGITQGVLVPNEELAGALARGRRAGAVVLAASKGRQFSYEPSGTRALVLDAAAPMPAIAAPTGDAHGFFTEALLHALGDDSTDRDGDGAIELTELVDAVTARVTKRSNGAQTPWVARRELIGDFALAPAPSGNR